ncbi:MAG: M23 family metallopeptidase [Chlorobiales bacterium]|nr:M23 family metallopeptidase [Chlorobiales bacterium]
MAKKHYRFSEEDCCYVEVRHSLKTVIGKAASYVAVLALSFGAIKAYGPDLLLDGEQRDMHKKIVKLTSKLNEMNAQLSVLSERDNLLRQAVNLSTQSDEEKAMGTGGSRDKIDSDAASSLLDASDKVIDQLLRKIDQQRTSYTEIMSKYEQNQKLFACVPAIKPTIGAKSSGFGMRFHPIFKVQRFHSGLDFIAHVGSNVYATGDAIVRHVTTDGGYGKLIVLDHGFGYQTLYAHLSEFKVKEGQHVKRGDVIGLSGNTGVSEGPHVHYEVVKNGVKVNPENFLFEDMDPREIAANQSSVDIASR